MEEDKISGQDQKGKGSSSFSELVRETQQMPTTDVKEGVSKGDEVIQHAPASADNPSINEGTKGDNKDVAVPVAGEVKRHTVLGRYHTLTQDEKAPVQKKYSDNVATIVVIVYTVLLLILGFLVYGDMSKSINSLEERVSSLEDKMKEMARLPVKEIKVYDLP